MKKYPKIKEFGSEDISSLQAGDGIYIEEKYDGSNFRFKVENGDFWYGSRNVAGLNNNREQFRKGIDGVEETTTPDEVEKVLEDKLGHSRATLFGECMTPHSLEYDWSKTPKVIMFDIYDEKEEKFVDYETRQEIFSELGFETPRLVTVVDKVTNDDLEIPDSEYRNGVAEGIVLKNYSTQTFSKKRSEEFFEKNDQTFGKSRKACTTDAERLVSKYCTNERIRKWIYKLRDEGHEMEMKMMEELPKRVWEDIWDEERNEIIWKNWEIDMHDARSELSSRCAKVLKNVIQEVAMKEVNDDR